MRTFSCPRCEQLVFFENSECLRCGAALGFAPGEGTIVLLDGDRWRRCANAGIASCNWALEQTSPDALCRSCELTRTRPPFDGTTDSTDAAAFVTAEAAKRRLVFQLGELSLPYAPRWREPGGIAFDFLSSRFGAVTTGHADGVITLDLAEGDDAHREQMRHELGEPYRTVLGHLRHEIGHYYWDVLVARTGRYDEYRARFGDERADYGASLAHHYETGAPPGWRDHYVSAYATSHPWEDWAETFAQYLHIRDTLQTAAAWGMVVVGPVVAAPAVAVDDERFERVLGEWLPLTYALNAISRSMGNDDLYPFVLSPFVIAKLAFVHDLVRTPISSAERREADCCQTR